MTDTLIFSTNGEKATNEFAPIILPKSLWGGSWFADYYNLVPVKSGYAVKSIKRFRSMFFRIYMDDLPVGGWTPLFRHDARKIYVGDALTFNPGALRLTNSTRRVMPSRGVDLSDIFNRKDLHAKLARP